MDKLFHTAVEHRVGVVVFESSAVVFDHFVGMQNVASYLAAPGNAALLAFFLLCLFFALCELAFIKAAFENFHRLLAVLVL